ncbi:TPA: type II toxin-antitoxin system RelE family toxin [Aeromonas veronii]
MRARLAKKQEVGQYIFLWLARFIFASHGNPFVESARLHGELSGCFKIKLRSSGYRLVYQVIDQELVILVIVIGKRDKAAAYEVANKRVG